ncbi:MAG: hypothetical protein P2A85_24895 [Microcoleus anatoxicus]|uniref:hypothetical protein n=1 Tax=Microcoleus anatoxicus TaxID=2705319 RepID=UPI00366F2D61
MAIYYDLKIPCPACIAKGGLGGYPSQWYHSNCGGKLQIGDDAYLRCIGCWHKEHIRHWQYSCETHETIYRPTRAGSFAKAVSMAAHLTGTAGIIWMIRLVDNMGDW